MKTKLHSIGHIPHKHPTSSRKNFRILEEYACVYLYRGQGFYQDNTNTVINVKQGDLILLFPGMPHHYGGDIEWHEYWAIFSGPYFEEWEKEGLISRDHPVITTNNIYKWEKSWQKLYEQFVERSLKELPLLSRFQTLLADMLTEEQADQSRPKWLTQALNQLEKQDSLLIQLEDLAVQSSYSYERFRKLFKQYTGMTPHLYRSKHVIELVKYDLLATDQSCAQIAQKYGFSDEYHFNRRFKEIVGSAPGTWRSKHHSNLKD
ncbi:MAG: AraC family transcriptional regulator [Lentisphaeria bacterium]|nr:AraC family transcriptional regulator [Lentisphaeria bacterium]